MNEVRGTATYRVPIVVPPGPAGHTPELALVYSSERVTGGAGWIGVGWQLAGLSAIERDRKFGVPYDYGTSCGAAPCYRNAFVLDGTDLVCTNSTCTGGGYKTQVDDGREIAYLGPTQGWRIRDREGRTLLYGTTSATRVDNPKNGEVFSWHLARITDASGNWIDVAYEKRQYPPPPASPLQGEVLYPSLISWAQAGAPANRFIEFELEPRGDIALDYTSGLRQQIDHRLARINAYAGGVSAANLVTRYQLGYTPSPDSGRSLLATVQRAGADADSQTPTVLPAHEFSYSTSSHAFTRLSYPNSFSAYPGPTRPVNAGSSSRRKGLVDIDGDALLDYLNVDHGSDADPALVDGRTYWERNLGRLSPAPDGGYAYLLDSYSELSAISAHLQRSWSVSNWCPNGESGWGCSRMDQQLGDFTGDGFADFLEAPDPAPCSWTLRPGTGGGALGAAIPWLSVPAHPGVAFGAATTGQCSASFAVGYSLKPDQVATLVDLNGDRLPDRVFSNTAPAGYWNVALNLGVNDGGTSASFAASRSWAEVSGRAIEEWRVAHLLDLNGDGLVDRLFRADSDASWQV